MSETFVYIVFYSEIVDIYSIFKYNFFQYTRGTWFEDEVELIVEEVFT